MNIGQRFRLWREENKISTKEIYEKTGIPKSTISSIERGRSLPSIKVLQPIAENFNISIDWLIDNEFTTKYDMNDEEMQLIEVFNKLDKKNRLLAIEELKHMLKVQKIQNM